MVVLKGTLAVAVEGAFNVSLVFDFGAEETMVAGADVLAPFVESPL